MKLHFDFYLDRSDAENLMDCVNHRVNDNLFSMVEELMKNDADSKIRIIELKRDNEYWKSLKEKMSNYYDEQEKT